jgi:hypothetical protein
MTDDIQNDTPAAGDEPRSAEEIRADIEQTRGNLGDTVEALAEKTDVKAQARDRVTAVKETVSSKAGDMVSRAREAAPESAGGGAQQVTATVQRQPLPFAVAGAFAGGLLIGWLLGRG